MAQVDVRVEGVPRWWRVDPLHREMGYVGGVLFTVGGLLAATGLAVPPDDYVSRGWAVAVVVAALVAGAFYLWSAEHLPMPTWGYAIGTSTGAVMVTVLVWAGGPDRTAVFGVLYVLVATYGFYYYGWALATWLVVLDGVGYAVALQLLDVDGAVSQWVMIMGTSVVGGALTGSLSQRVRRLLAVEQDTVRTLSELDGWKTTFLRAVAHDLRSPLSVMLGMVELVRDRDAELDPAARARLLDRSVAAGERLDQLLNDLLDIQRIAAGVLEPELERVAVDELVADVVERIDAAPRTVVLDLAPVTALVEPAKVDRIVTNLVRNALHHTADDVTVWVRLAERGRFAVLVVEDDGTGVAPELREALFEAFRRHGTGHGSGVGLGLHLVRRFTELHGGVVRYRDRPGGGACFEVQLPLDGAAGGSLDN